MSLRIEGARVLGADGTWSERVLATADGRWVEPADLVDPEVLDATGCWAVPGFVELHGTLGSLDRDGAAAVRGGFTTVATAPDGPPTLDEPSRVRDLLQRAARRPRGPEVLAVGALSVGLEGQTPAPLGSLQRAGARLVSHGRRGVVDGGRLRSLLEAAAGLKLRVMVRGSDPTLESGGVVRTGAGAVLDGLPGVPPEAEQAAIHRIAAIADLVGWPVHVSHVWSRAGVDALQAEQARSRPISGSTTAHHLAALPWQTADERYDVRFRLEPPLGDHADRAGLAAAVLDGTLTAVASDHRPVPTRDRSGGFVEATPGALGFETALPLVLAAVDGDLARAAHLLGNGVRGVLGIPPRSLAVGEPADLVLVDPVLRWRVEQDRLAGSDGTSPVDGRTLTGGVRATLVRGQVVEVVGLSGRVD